MVIDIFKKLISVYILVNEQKRKEHSGKQRIQCDSTAYNYLSGIV